MPLFLLHAVLMGAGFLLALSAHAHRDDAAAETVVAPGPPGRRGLRERRRCSWGPRRRSPLSPPYPSRHHFASPHTWVGGLTVALAAGAATLGLLQFRIPAKAAAFRALHRLAGGS